MWRKVSTPPPFRTCTPLSETLVNRAASSILLSFLFSPPTPLGEKLLHTGTPEYNVSFPLRFTGTHLLTLV